MGQVVIDPEVAIAKLNKLDADIKELRELFTNGFTTKPIQAEAHAFDTFLLNGVEWKEGQYGEYVYADDYLELNKAITNAGGKTEVDGYIYSIGRNPKYINKNRPRQNSSQQSTNPNDPATDKQKQLMTKLKISFNPNITKSEASKIIDQKLKA